MRKPLVAANWKMHQTRAEVRQFADRLPELSASVESVICPPAILLPILAEALGVDSPVRLGAQNMHPANKGAFTGEHSAPMLRDADARYVIVGHSERRGLFGEEDDFVAEKVKAALKAGLRPILCIGEVLAEREEGATFRVLRGQLTAALSELGAPAPDPADLVVAYEPIWAIGTGRTASVAQAGEALAFVRERLAEIFGWAWADRVRLLYGGSATPENATDLASRPDLDGFLVGGASLDPEKFARIVLAMHEARAAKKEGPR
ncbi:MAG: triose-phosphate isomerase [Deltaproteobacteria bacterium]|nr:triose-phosphate isomerase [Deltaproteobacteria bacterium]